MRSQQLLALFFGKVLQDLYVQLQLLLVDEAHVLEYFIFWQHVQNLKCQRNEVRILCDGESDVDEDFNF
jgi:hypothetical protein